MENLIDASISQNKKKMKNSKLYLISINVLA